MDIIEFLLVVYSLYVYKRAVFLLNQNFLNMVKKFYFYT